jgi:hypothetical protein
MSNFEQTPSQAGPGTEAWEVFWTWADDGRVYASDGFSPTAVAAGAAALQKVLAQESYSPEYFSF